MATKFYAVAAGKQTGIFTKWAIVEPLIKGFPGAIYKSFKTETEAQNFLQQSTFCKLNQTPLTSPIANKTLIYTDGSYGNKICGFGIVIITNENDKYIAYGRVPENISNIKSGSDVAELYAIYVALSLVMDDIILYTDSTYAVSTLTTYVYNWIKNGWGNTKNRDLIEAIYNKMLNRDISFQHVKGHKDSVYNIECDKLAEQGRLGTDNLIVFKNGTQIIM